MNAWQWFLICGMPAGFLLGYLFGSARQLAEDAERISRIEEDWQHAMDTISRLRKDLT